jgi:hypothetical protein
MSVKTLAVIGGGTAGIICAYLLQPYYEVTIYDEASRLGGHVHTINIDQNTIDVGVSLITNKQYHFRNLLTSLSLDLSPISYSDFCQVINKDHNKVSQMSFNFKPTTLINILFDFVWYDYILKACEPYYNGSDTQKLFVDVIKKLKLPQEFVTVKLPSLLFFYYSIKKPEPIEETMRRM